MKKTLLSLITLIALTNPTNLIAQDYVWAKSSSGTGNEYLQAMTVDATGNTYVTGRFESTVDFDPGTGTTNLTSLGFEDIFLAKYNTDGDLVWAKAIGGTNYDRAYGIALDASNNIFITGTFYGTCDFDPDGGTNNQTSQGSADIFIAKYDNSGVLSWVYATGSGGDDQARSIALDPSGNAYITGYYSFTVDFDPSGSNLDITSVGGPHDVFVASYTNSGVVNYAISIGDVNTDRGFALAVDNNGNSYVTGYFSGTVDMDPGVGTSNITSATTSSDVFVAKYSNTGIYQWAFKIGGSTYDVGNDIITDGTNVYVTGYFESTADFDPSGSTANLTSKGGSDIFAATYTIAGAYVRAIGMGSSTAADIGNSIFTDSNGNVYVGGTFKGTCDFDPSGSAANLTASTGGLADAFIAKYDNTGTYVYAQKLGSSSIDDNCNGIFVDASDNLYVSGHFGGTVDFDFSGTTNSLTSAGLADLFIAKYSQIVGIKEQASQSKIELYPNPATSEIVVNLNSININSIVIVDILGKEVVKISKFNFVSEKIDISNIPSGVYFLKVLSNNQIIGSRKIVKK